MNTRRSKSTANTRYSTNSMNSMKRMLEGTTRMLLMALIIAGMS